jgi:hypothetical protein
MPWIIDYQLVLEQMREQRFKCLYYNSGAFGFPADATTQSVGWIGPPDDSIKPAARALVRPVAPPFEQTLTDLTMRAWRELLPGRVWAMPKSHWAYELDYGSRDWMPALLENIEIDPGLLEGRNNAAAIEFADHEDRHLQFFIERLLQMLLGSDFLLAFPRRATTCTIHSHKQIWWTTADPVVAMGLDQLVPTSPSAAAPNQNTSDER